MDNRSAQMESWLVLGALQVAEGRNVYLEMAGNIAPVTKDNDQLRICFHVFHESRLPFSVRVRDATQPAGARMAFISEPRPARNGILGTPSPLPGTVSLYTSSLSHPGLRIPPVTAF